ncbi:MAG TPA: hypothetical protein QF624_05625 [Dehalococcoidia bacterium]|nr:hypothetical protein [Dehalococcoidia bacterium]
MQESIFDAFPEAEFRVAIVWIDIMDSDTPATALSASVELGDGRASYFHDPTHHAGRALARSLDWQRHVPWDAYLFYAPGQRWDGEAPPPPSEWFHALQDREVWEETLAAEGAEGTGWTEHLAEESEADPERFRRDRALTVALRDAGTEWLARS